MAYLIVGQGVAGTLLALEFERRGVDYNILDLGINHSSAVAAGIMNPVVFRRLTKSWRIDECWDLALNEYKALEEKFGATFIHKKTMRRLFSGEQEAEFWREKTNLPEFSRFITLFPEGTTAPSYTKNFWGQGLVKEVHHIDVVTFLNHARMYFEKQNRIQKGGVDYTKTQKDLETKQISGVIFCQGYQNFENPFFKSLPVQCTKGQTLTVKMCEVSEQELLNRKCFVLPMGNEHFRIGATYEWDETSMEITKEAREDLSEKLSALVNVDFEVVDQEAGIRPTSPDRRPILGAHPEIENMYLLNGLGAKGYLLAPWAVRHLSSHIFDDEELLPEVNLKRFTKR